jgi:hypothetical protein
VLTGGGKNQFLLALCVFGQYFYLSALSPFPRSSFSGIDIGSGHNAKNPNYRQLFRSPRLSQADG